VEPPNFHGRFQGLDIAGFGTTAVRTCDLNPVAPSNEVYGSTHDPVDV
jgi:hypothetical protein